MPKHRKSPELEEKISILPSTPGVYMYYDSEGNVIYVGKAKNLKRRVSSYFNRTHDSLRTNLLVRAIADMRYIVVPTEQDALNLENSMIKEYQPRYNVLLKDDKSYPWIVVTKEPYPRVFMTRKRIKDGAKYYGPYTDTASARTVLDLIRELYKLRSCRHLITPEYIAKGKGRLCLDYHLKRCGGPCTGMVSQEEYAASIERVKQILRGDMNELLDHLREEMTRLAEQLRFEEAHELKLKYDMVTRYTAKSVIVSQTIGDVDVFGIYDDGSQEVYINYMHVRRGAVVSSITLEYKRRLDESAEQLLGYAMEEIRSELDITYEEVIAAMEPDVEMPGVTFIVPRRGDKQKLLEVSERNARQYKIDALKHMERHNPEERVNRLMERMKADFRLEVLPRHIECFDNSNIQGTNPVASCVVFRDGKPAKNDYRHFNIKTVVGPDDFASMKEVLTRRYTRLVNEGKELPQLIVVDGGKGQLSAAVALEAMGLRGTIAVAGIAKRLEEIYFPGDSVPLYIDKNSETLRVVQHMRDEAHRFGITHHRNRRSKTQTVSALDSIKGIGEKTRTALLTKFRSLKRISEADLDDIAAVVGPAKASIVYNALHPSD